MSCHVVCVLNAVVDISVPITAFPVQAGQHQRTTDKVVITAGGQATTLLCGARMGLQMQALGNVGQDEIGSLWRRQLTAEGVDVYHMIVRDDCPTSISVVPSDLDGQHVFLHTSKGANSGPLVIPEEWNKQISKANVLVLDGWSYRSMGPDVNQAVVEIANSSGTAIFFDPGPEIMYASKMWTQAMLAASTIVLLTYEEAQQISGQGLDFEQMAEKIMDMGPEIVLLKLGPSGILAKTADETLYQPGIEVQVRDTTGAGDSLIAAAAYSYGHRHSLESMVTLANATGAACVQKLGTGINAPTKEEILEVLDRFSPGG